jgi:ribonuclease HI
MKKYFAIRYKEGNTDLNYDNWENVKKSVIGVSGVTFKGFEHEDDALSWLDQESILYRHSNLAYEQDSLYLFVDGSYSSKLKVSGWGWCAVINDEKIAEGYGVLPNPIESRNICGELKATMEAVKWYVTQSRTNLRPVIVHDYSGIGNWALGYWSANKKVAIDYKNFMMQYKDIFAFEKVSGHSGHKWNEYADALTHKGDDK